MSRDTDERVAAEVFGWRWYSQRGKAGLNPNGERVFHFAFPNYNPPSHWKNVVDDKPTGKGKEYLTDMGMARYSTDVAAAWSVVERMREDGFNFTLNAFTPDGYGGGCQVSFVCNKGPCEKHGNPHHNWHGATDVEAATFPEAVCKAALAAVTPNPQRARRA